VTDPLNEAGRRHFFEEFADFMGSAYLRYSFTKGTENEVSFLWDTLQLRPGMSVLDVGCGPGRHALALARRGADVVGVDIAEAFIDLATQASLAEQLNVRFEIGDARRLTYDRQFDAVISLCQGGFGLVGRSEDGSADAIVLDRMVAALKPGGRIALSAFSAYFQLQHLESTDEFDAATGVNRETTEIRNQSGDRKSVELFTTCFTPLELRLLAERSGLHIEHLWSVTPGDYGAAALTIDRPEFLLIAQAPDQPY
jgi:2-polyprenyl-3-methyl-5-hydroxy-6-metoxy-1,4-benzoquinol methylase